MTNYLKAFYIFFNLIFSKSLSLMIMHIKNRPKTFKFKKRELESQCKFYTKKDFKDQMLIEL